MTASNKMSTIRILMLAFLAFIYAGCSMPTVGSLLPGTEGTRAPHVVFHADVDFAPDERAVIQEACDTWRLQTSGVAQIRVVYDLDFSSVSSLTEHQLNLDNVLVRRTSGMDSVMSADDEGCDQDDPRTEHDEHQCVLGWMTSGGIHNPYHKPVVGSFITDRWPAKEIALQVVIHEFGHALGVPHVSSIQAIMYPSVHPARAACLKKQDLDTFCQVNECNNKRMYPCE